MWGRNARFKAKLAASLDGESETEEKLKKESLLSEPTVPVPVPPRSTNGAENSQIYKRKRVREHQVSVLPNLVSSKDKKKPALPIPDTRLQKGYALPLKKTTSTADKQSPKVAYRSNSTPLTKDEVTPQLYNQDTPRITTAEGNGGDSKASNGGSPATPEQTDGLDELVSGLIKRVEENRKLKVAPNLNFGQIKKHLPRQTAQLASVHMRASSTPHVSNGTISNVCHRPRAKRKNPASNVSAFDRYLLKHGYANGTEG